MTLSHEEASTRLLDFVYAALPDEEQTAMASHVAGCPRCTIELGRWTAKRALAAAALRGSLDEAPPEGLRAKILAAAAAEVGADTKMGATTEPGRATRAASSAEAMRVPRARAGARTDERGRVAQWLAGWRRVWVVPALSVAAVFALFLVSRTTLFRSYDEGAAKLAAPAAPGPAVPAPPAPSPAAPETASAPVPGEPKAEPAPAPHQKGHPRPSPKRAEKTERGQREDDLLSEEHAAAKKESIAAPRGAGAAFNAAARASAKPAEKATADFAGGLARAAPPEGTADVAGELERSAAPRAATQAPAAPKQSPVRTGAPEAATQASTEPTRRYATPPPAAVEERAPAAPATDRASEPEVPASGGAAPLDREVAVKRAEAAFASRQWSLAARAFRALIRTYPDDARVPTWKARAEAATQAASR